MIRKVITASLAVLGLLFGMVGTFMRWLITSDIPVSYKASEAMSVQYIFFAATICFVLAVLISKTKEAALVAGCFFLVLFLIQMYSYTRSVGTGYYTSSYAQLSSIVMFLCWSSFGD
ncbi:hypothetical protein H0266_17360 [Halobacillus locisalis]|uniref:Uncharacterized protein n=1 Tax=Halobacillus locisalis TaxID=220753 RepID=A0A838CXV0_9BACI|nr:hypothetical protein [Halobacillus locisalis]MBA2176659.1 hypothetical protein [Halobacillus locisalis]